jgi:hypothetical protein
MPVVRKRACPNPEEASLAHARRLEYLREHRQQSKAAVSELEAKVEPL